MGELCGDRTFRNILYYCEIIQHFFSLLFPTQFAILPPNGTTVIFYDSSFVNQTTFVYFIILRLATQIEDSRLRLFGQVKRIRHSINTSAHFVHIISFSLFSLTIHFAKLNTFNILLTSLSTHNELVSNKYNSALKKIINNSR